MLIGIFIIYLSFMMWGCKLNLKILTFLKNFFSYSIAILVGILNIFHSIVTFSQINYFLHNFFFDNLIYFTFLLVGGSFKIALKRQRVLRKVSEENGLSE